MGKPSPLRLQKGWRLSVQISGRSRGLQLKDYKIRHIFTSVHSSVTPVQKCEKNAAMNFATRSRPHRENRGQAPPISHKRASGAVPGLSAYLGISHP